jgi:hypothetical protein
MFLATGDAKFADVYERALYNGVISGVSLSGDKFFYDNPLESMGQHERQHWFGCACCPGNITRFIASVPTYMYATQGDDILVNLYIQSSAKIPTGSDTVNIKQTTQYPWQGEVAFDINPTSEKEFALRLRVPGWSQDSPVPTNLYSFTDKAKTPVTVRVNGKKVTPLTGNGYAVIKRTWKPGDKVELSIPMEVRRVKAIDSVADDRGKLAIERGPIMYCLEGKDQPDSIVFNKFIPGDTKFTTNYEPQLLGGVMTLEGTAKEVDLKDNVKDVPFKAIPYATWNNRGADQMAVWIPEAAQYAHPTPEPTIASRAEMFSEPTTQNVEVPAATSNLQWAWGYNDQWEPKSSADTSKPYHYWWLRRGSLENVCYRFDKPYEVSSVDVYWLDFDHYDGNYRVPASWKLYYKNNAGKWTEVDATSPYGVEKDKYNHLTFKPVTTDALKLSVMLQDGQSGGVIEWKVN